MHTMKAVLLVFATALFFVLGTAQASEPAKADGAPDFQPTAWKSAGSVGIGDSNIAYDAVVGTLVVHPKGWSDVAAKDDDKNPTAEASMSYVAYFKRDGDVSRRPLTFVFNGGPGSSTVWLHMGAFGPRRVKLMPDGAAPPPPYTYEDNPYTLLDQSDLVFLDPVGTGYSRPANPKLGAKFWGVNEDIASVAEFIRSYLTTYERWAS